jgi:hypothetical protein
MAAHGTNRLDVGLQSRAAGGIQAGEYQNCRAFVYGAFHHGPFYHRHCGCRRGAKIIGQLNL